MAIQCLETAFGVSLDDKDLAVSQTLPEIFEAAVGKVSTSPEHALTFNPGSPRGELCLFSAVLLPPQRRVGGKCCGPDEFGLGEAGFCSVGVLLSAQRSPFSCKEPEHTRTNSEPITPSEDDVAEAERLKTEGRASSGAGREEV